MEAGRGGEIEECYIGVKTATATATRPNEWGF